MNLLRWQGRVVGFCEPINEEESLTVIDDPEVEALYAKGNCSLISIKDGDDFILALGMKPS